VSGPVPKKIADYIAWLVFGVVVGAGSAAYEAHKFALAAFWFLFAIALLIERCVDKAADKVVAAIGEMKDEIVAAVDVPESEREEQRQQRELE
jgi:hypothetical protein